MKVQRSLVLCKMDAAVVLDGVEVAIRHWYTSGRYVTKCELIFGGVFSHGKGQSTHYEPSNIRKVSKPNPILFYLLWARAPP